jgi:16S rRNA (cytosine967-C5)-methyltransferase
MTDPSSAAPGADVRSIAVALYRSCLDRKITVEEAVEGDTRARKLPARDRALLANILLTCFRHKGESEAVLNRLLDKPLPRKSGATMDILILGVAQLLFLDMPPHAVIDLSVRAAKEDRNALHFAGVVNAVLRKVAAPDQASSMGSMPGSSIHLAGCGTGGRRHTVARLQGSLVSLTPQGPHWISASRTDGSIGRRCWAQRQCRTVNCVFQPIMRRCRSFRAFGTGAWWVQDAAATIPVDLLGEIGGLNVLDLCAAPGGKTLQMAARGARVTAVDMSDARLGRLRANLARTGLEAEVRTEDMLSSTLQGEWDAVLLDAPCTATGTIRRHPELPHLRRESQIKELSGLQRQMLSKAARLVKRGGMLVYCTCSLEPEEGEAQLRWFQGWNSEFEAMPAALPWLPQQAIGPEGWVRTLPFMRLGDAQGMDGFFAAVLRRKP